MLEDCGLVESTFQTMYLVVVQSCDEGVHKVVR